MINYIVESASQAKAQIREHTIFDRILLIISNDLPSNINVKGVIRDIESKVPEHLLGDVDSIYIGDFQPLRDRQVDSLYIDGTILVNNDQPSDKELFSTLVHEFAHASEEIAKNFLYVDGDLSREFIAKRKTLYNLLKDDYQLNKKDFLSINFSQNFDDFIYKTIGYDNLGVITNGLFMSPYAATSLREYFANGFEHYFLRDGRELREISPVLYRKIRQILKPDYNQ